MLSICMQKRAGLLFLSKKTKRIFLILENSTWTIPTFARKDTLLEDAQILLDRFSHGKLLPIELYLSKDQEFEYGTYICLIEDEFLTSEIKTICWARTDDLPKNLHAGLKNMFNSSIIKTKIETIIELSSID